MRWISDIKMPHRSQQIVLQESIDTMYQCKSRVQRLTGQIQKLLPDWDLFPVVQALQSLRGVPMLVAATTVAKLGDLKRFYHPFELMGYLGIEKVGNENYLLCEEQFTKKGGFPHVHKSYVPWFRYPGL